MKLLDRIIVHDSSAKEHAIELFRGDITRLSASAPVDVLVLSAFPDDYSPTPTSLIGSLHTC